jgi:hypothetical protein
MKYSVHPEAEVEFNQTIDYYEIWVEGWDTTSQLHKENNILTFLLKKEKNRKIAYSEISLQNPYLTHSQRDYPSL